MMAMAMMVLVAGAFVSCSDDDEDFEAVGTWKATKLKLATNDMDLGQYKEKMPLSGFKLKEDKSVELLDMKSTPKNHKFVWEEKDGNIVITAEVKGAEEGHQHKSGGPTEYKLKIDGSNLIMNMKTANVAQMMGEKAMPAAMKQALGEEFGILFEKE